MEIAVAPPRKISVGKVFDIPLVVIISPLPDGNHNGHHDQNVGDLWAYVSLISAESQICLVPPQEGLLQGQRADSIHPPSSSSEISNRIAGYAAFPDLKISEPGRYCFRINLIDMNR